MRGLPWMIGVASACWCGEPPAADTEPIERASPAATPPPATPLPAATITVPAGVYPVPNGEVWVAGFRLGLPALPGVGCPLPSPEERWIAQSFDTAPGQPGYEELAYWPDCGVCQAVLEAEGVWGFSHYYGGGGDPGDAELTEGSETSGLWSLFAGAGEPPAPLHARCITRNESPPREAWVSATQVPLQPRRGPRPPDRDDAPPSIPLRTGARVEVLYSDGRWAWVRHGRRWFDLDGKATVQNKLAIRPRWHPAGRRRGDPALPCDIRPVCLGPGCTPLLARRAPPRPQLASWFCTVA